MDDTFENKASTVTMIASLNTTVNIELLYDLFSVMYPRNPDGSRFFHPKNIRNKIPFFGITNSIICVKYKGKIRGIRQNEGQMNNVVSIDLQVCNKNINLKLARTNIQLTGATSYEMGEHAFKVLCAHVNMINDNVAHIRSLEPELRKKTIEWVLEEVTSQREIRLAESPLIEVKGLPAMDLEKINLTDGIDKKTASFMWQFTEDFDTLEPYLEKIERVSTFINDETLKIIESELGLDNIRISNSVYNFNLGKEVSLIQLTKHLMKKGFSVEFHNWNATHLKISIPIEEEETESVIEPTTTAHKIKAHRFSVHKNFSIKQTSPSCYDQAIEARNLFLMGISDYVPKY